MPARNLANIGKLLDKFAQESSGVSRRCPQL
jgi:hypothetical protein